MNPLGQSVTAEERLERQRLFRAACALAGRSMRSLAEEWGVHEGHLYFVLRGDRESRRLEEAVSAFIKQHLPGGTIPADLSLAPMPELEGRRD